jgi:hypothetical protein
MVGIVWTHWYNNLSEWDGCTTGDQGSGKHTDNGPGYNRIVSARNTNVP